MLFTGEARTAGDNQNIVFQTDAPEVLVCVYCIEIQEISVHFLRTPFVYQVRNEITARLVSDDKPLLQAAPHTQGSQSKLVGRAYFFVITYVTLPQVFHIVHINAHHVTQSVRHEQGVRTCFYGILYIAFHQPQILQSLRQHLTSFDMDRFIRHSGACQFQRTVVACQYDAIYITLAAGELTSYRNGTCMVRTIIGNAFSSRIGQHQPSCLQDLTMVMIVQGLPVLA